MRSFHLDHVFADSIRFIMDFRTIFEMDSFLYLLQPVLYISVVLDQLQDGMLLSLPHWDPSGISIKFRIPFNNISLPSDLWIIYFLSAAYAGIHSVDVRIFISIRAI
jgi:hypothetical protein